MTRMTCKTRTLTFALTTLSIFGLATVASAQQSAAGTRADDQRTSGNTQSFNGNTSEASLMSQAFSTRIDWSRQYDQQPHNLNAVSMFSLEVEMPREFRKHDLVEIVVRETSQAKSSQELESSKEFDVNGSVTAWPDLRLRDILDLRLNAGEGTNLPAVGVTLDKEFKGEGDYERKDDFTARLTAEIVEVKPNGNLVLEARTRIKTDEEESTIKVSGICRAEDITPANTVQSFQIHDLVIEKMHKGELKKNTEKGIVTQVLDALFGF